MHLHAIPPHKVQKSPPLNVQSYKKRCNFARIVVAIFALYVA